MPEQDVGQVVAGLKAQMDMIVDILKEIQKDIKSNYMPTAQIEDKFKAQGDRINRIEGTLKTMDQDVKDKFVALALSVEGKFNDIAKSDKEQNEKRKESPYKIIGAIGGLIVIFSAAVSSVIWLIKSAM